LQILTLFFEVLKGLLCFNRIFFLQLKNDLWTIFKRFFLLLLLFFIDLVLNDAMNTQQWESHAKYFQWKKKRTTGLLTWFWKQKVDSDSESLANNINLMGQ